MKLPHLKLSVFLLLLLGITGASVWFVSQDSGDTSQKTKSKAGGTQAAPVEVASIEHGSIELHRTFTGTLKAYKGFVVAPKVSGRIEQLHVDLADSVVRGQLVAELDSAEYQQAVVQAKADLMVAKAYLAEAQSLLEIAQRELARVEELRQRGVSSASLRDAAKAEQLAKEARVQVTKAQVARAEAELEAARIRLGYTKVTADWRGGSAQRVVAEHYVDEGETVSANTPLLRIVELDPITAVFFVTERDYSRLQAGQTALLNTDAYADLHFQGQIERIAPVFHENTRQARVELLIANPELRLKPGMFMRASVILEKVAETTIIPEQALAIRAGHRGVFRVAADGQSVRWQEVEIGIQQGERLQVTGQVLTGRVVILGHQSLSDGSAITVVGAEGIVKP